MDIYSNYKLCKLLETCEFVQDFLLEHIYEECCGLSYSEKNDAIELLDTIILHIRDSLRKEN